MKKFYYKAAILAVCSFFTQNAVSQVVLAQDNASAYTVELWTTWNAIPNAGFTPWFLQINGDNDNGEAGYLVGSSTADGFGDVNTDGKAFGLYGYKNDPANPDFEEAVVRRYFTATGAEVVPDTGGRTPMLPGQKFEIDLAVAFRNGYKGIDLLASNGDFLWNFGMDGDTRYQVNGFDIFENEYMQQSVFEIEAYQLTTNTFKVTITRGEEVWESPTTYTGNIGGFKIYQGSSRSANVLNRLYFNNLKVTECPDETIYENNTWSNGLPEIYKRVIIRSDYTPAGNMEACTLTIENGANVLITTGHTLTVSTTINVEETATLTIQNNAALVQISKTAVNEGNITVRRNSNPLYRLDYTMWGAPVYGQQLFDFSPLTSVNPSRFYTYGILGNGNEGYLSTDHTQDFEPGNGYLIRMPNSIPAIANYNSGGATHVVEGEFTGTPVNGTVQVAVNGMAGHYIAVANPYASPISVAQFFAQNSGVIEQGAGIYFWRKRNNANNSSYGNLSLAGYSANNDEGGDVGDEGYYEVIEPAEGEEATFNQNWIISPGQGFIVGIKDNAAATDNVVFTNTMRRPAGSIANGQPFFRTLNNNNSPAISRWKLNLTGTNTFAQTLVAYLPQGTTGIDYGYDAQAHADGNTRLYSKADALNMAIQARPSFTDTDVVPVGFTVLAAGQYTITLDQLDGVFAQDQDIYLKDNLLGTQSNLKTAAYTFSTDAGAFDTRFEVTYQAEGELGTNTPGAQNAVVVYQNNGAINITSGTIEMNSITLLDVNGRTLYSQTGINCTQAAITSLNIAHRVLIVQVETASGKVSRKIVY